MVGVEQMRMDTLIFPAWRKVKKSGWPRIEVTADSMRVGKSTAVKVIADGMRNMGRTVTESYEDWQHNPFLQMSYADPAKNFLDSQKWFIKRKWEQVTEGGYASTLIQDVSPETDFCYAATNLFIGRMSQSHFDEYKKYYQNLDWDLAPAPDLLVYLSVSDDTLLQRAMDSRREFETVEPEYFLMMKKVNREWLSRAKDKMNILIVDTDNLNFASEQVAKDKLVELTLARVNL